MRRTTRSEHRNVTGRVVRRRYTGSVKRPPSPRAAASGLPEWAPWAVLVALIALGSIASLALARSTRANGTQHADTPARVVAPPAAPSFTAAEPTPAPNAASGEPALISVMHLVVTHADSVMGRTLKITRSKEAAKKRATEAMLRARKGEDFGQLVVEYSEEPGAQKTKGQLLNFERKDAIPSFADAAFKLKVGEISDPVDTPFGWMIIDRTK